jgi:hypothetical protein
MDEAKLVFIISQPRSGSTLLQGILSNNPYVATTSESWLLLPFLGYFQPGLHQSGYNYDMMRDALDDFIEKTEGKEEFKRRIKDLILSLYSHLDAPGVKYVMDKTPRYYEILDLIYETFPKAKFIILKRNPFAVLYSMMKSWNLHSLEKLHTMRDDILLAPAKIHHFAQKHRGEPNVREVCYEHLLREADSFESLYRWLDLPYDKSVLAYSGNSKVKGKYGDHVGFTQHTAPTLADLDKWKNLLNVKFWKDFLSGYSAFLGADFLKDYGGYDSIGKEPTEQFNYFLFLQSLEEKDRWKLFDKRIVTHYFKYRLKFGAPSKVRSIAV